MFLNNSHYFVDFICARTLNAPINGAVTYDYTSAVPSAWVACHEGYELQARGESTIVCRSSLRVWDPARAPDCTGKFCSSCVFLCKHF